MKTIFIIAFILLALGTAGYVVKGKGVGDNTQQTTGSEQGNTTNTTVTRLVLNLSGQGLTKAPAYIFDRTDIQELNLSNNSLDGALQAEIRQLQNLKVLNLSNNKFTGVPAEVGQLKNLEVLDLSNNQLTGLPYELGNLSKLKLLDVSGNAYSEADLSKIRASLPPSTVVKTR